MAVTTEISWGDGTSDKIYLTRNASEGNQTVSVSSDANTGAARSKVVTFSASGVSPVTLTVSQAAGGIQPVFHEWLVFDGTAYIDTTILWPENGSMRCEMGRETVKATQRVFAAGNSSGLVGIIWGGGTNSTRRQVLPYYDSTSYLVSNYYFAFSYSTGGVFLTPKKVGYGTNNKNITKGTSRPSTALVIGNNYGHSGQSFTGSMKTFYIYGSDAQNVTSYAGFDSYTPVYTLRPCVYNNQAGLWCVETNTFFGNSAGSGSLSVADQ